MKNLNEALFEFQKKSVAVHKQSKADRYKYADLPTVMDAIIDPLNECGLLLRQKTQILDDSAVLVTTITHVASGEYDESSIILFMDDKPQAFGSRMTYLRRYSILTLLGLAPEDDDGAAAQLDRDMNRRFGATRVSEPSKPAGDNLGNCRDCGAPNTTYKSGKVGCSKLCWKDKAASQRRQAEPVGEDNLPW